MGKIWVRNVTTNDINKVGSLNFGSDKWSEAYNEMISKGYVFEIGKPEGTSNSCFGLYLVNPLDINIEPSDYDIVNRLNEKIKKVQEQNIEFSTERQEFLDKIQVPQEIPNQKTPQDLSLKQLLKELESECRSAANFQNSPAIWFAPAGAVDELINSQKKSI